MTRLLIALVSLFLAFSPASAEVDVRFYSRDFGEVFPHAFFEVEGPGVPKRNYGFTAKTISPAILWGAVAGEVMQVKPSYVAKSTHHFTLRVSDEAYRRLIAVADAWAARGPKSYDLYKANCVSFIADAVRAMGLRTNPNTKFKGKPKSFLLEVMQLNPGLRP